MPPDYAQTPLHLPAMASWPPAWHEFDEQQRDALRAAEAAGRPLLVRGDPGTGKSQLAHAAAFASGRAFLPLVVDSRTEATDLLWRFDAIARLADAHLCAVAGADVPTGLASERYLRPGPLWWAFDWNGASDQCARLRSPEPPPETAPDWTPAKGCVVLIDEIDKAEAELPNGLLEALGNGRFSVAALQGKVVRQNPAQPPPLVVITTNDERELPPAFLRRCLVLTLKLPEGAELKQFLLRRGRLHRGAWAKANEAVLEQAADMLLDDRRDAQAAGIYTPGLAEYLDLLRALEQVGGSDPGAMLQRLRAFTYQKQPGGE
ncbi:MAG: MoxR family ATPase [Rhodanobacteraceae bacterium]|nr:MoxR family ATPase [Rhodanobacteraceae bacterium]